MAVRDPEKTPLSFDNGQPPEMNGTFQQPQLLNLLVENSPVSIGISTIDGIPVYANRSAQTMVGAGSLEEVQRTAVPEQFVPEEQTFVRDVMLPAVQEKGSWQGELNLRHFRTGEPIPVLYHMLRVDDPKTGQPTQLASIARDLRDRKKGEWRDAFLVRLDDALRPLVEPEEIVGKAAQQLGEHLGADRCAYSEVEDDQETAHLVGEYTRALPRLPRPYRLAQFGSAFAHSMRADILRIMEDSEDDSRSDGVREAFRRAGIRAAVAMPLHKTGRLVAIMALHQSTPRRWRPEEVELLQLVANRCWESLERARVTRAFQVSERRRRLTQRAGRLGSFEWLMTEGRVIWTPELEALYDVPEGTFEGTLNDWIKRVVPADAERVIADVQDCIAQKQPEYTYEFRAILPDGTLRWLRGQSQFVYGESGAAERMLGVNIDIDARKQAEAHLEQQWRTFDTALSNSPDHTFTFDLEGRFTYANRTLLSLFERPMEQVLGRNVYELDYPPELAARIQRQVQQVIETRKPVRDQTPFAGPSGAMAHFEYIFAPIFAAEGHVEGVAGSSRDITEQNKAAEALRKSEERLTFALEAGGGVGTWDWDIPNDRVYCNSQFARLFSVPPERGVAGAPIAEFTGNIHPDDRERVGQTIDQAIQTGGEYTAEYRVLQKDAVRWIYTRGRCHLDGAGRPVRFPGVVFDITERKEAEQALRRANRELEEFAYVASHDLQEPLRMVNIYTQQILRAIGHEDAQLAAYGGFVRQGVKRMETLIHDLLTFSRTVHGDELPIGAADLSAALAEAISVLGNTIEETGATITAQPLPKVRGDTPQMAHVFQNLLSNALKYRQTGVAPVIEIRARREGSHWTISVKDNGIGFEQQYADRIFGLFKRLHKGDYPGTGLGLAICQRIIERYGGRIWADAKPGQGARFHLALPAVEDPDLAAHSFG